MGHWERAKLAAAGKENVVFTLSKKRKPPPVKKILTSGESKHADITLRSQYSVDEPFGMPLIGPGASMIIKTIEKGSFADLHTDLPSTVLLKHLVTNIKHC